MVAPDAAAPEKPEQAKPEEASPSVKPEEKTPQLKPQDKIPPPPAKPQEEKQTNCLGCNKPLNKLKVYYRNGKFYCNKKCWRKSMESKEQKKETEKVK